MNWSREWRIFFILALSMPSILNAQESTEPVLHRDRPEEWSRAIRGFRREHNFSLSYGLSSNLWRGRILDGGEDFKFTTKGYQMRIGYAFHLPLVGRFGYYLGTKVSAILSSGNKAGVGREVSYGLPGLDAGFVLNASDHLRFSAGLERGWQRVEYLKMPEDLRRKRITISGETHVWHGQVDYFYELSWALQLEYETTFLSYASSEKLQLRKSSQMMSLGLLKHLI